MVLTYAAVMLLYDDIIHARHMRCRDETGAVDPDPSSLAEGDPRPLSHYPTPEDLT